jgi:hypothetical protein
VAELKPYFVTGHREDMAGIMRTYGAGARTRIPIIQYLSSIAYSSARSTPCSLARWRVSAAQTAGAGIVTAVALGVLTVLVVLAALVLVVVRQARRTWYDRDSPP